MSEIDWRIIFQRSRKCYGIVTKLSNIVSLHFFKKKMLLKKNSKVVSFTFDDFSKTAADNGAKILESYGKYGTFYVSFSLCSKNIGSYKIAEINDVISLINKGHEIGCHTFSHMDCMVNSSENILIDCKKNKLYAENELGIKLFSFAYPKGNLTPFVKKKIAKEYATNRTVAKGINYNAIDVSALKGVQLYEKHGFSKCLPWLNQLEKKDGWLIFYTHDVSENPSQFGCSVKLFEKIVKRCVEKNFVICTIKDIYNDFLQSS